MKYVSPIDLNQLELLNAVVQNLASAPSSPKQGQQYYDTGLKTVLTWNGVGWRPADAAKLTDGSIPIAALAVDPRARSTHTGSQLASTISDLSATVWGYGLHQFAAPSSNVSFGSVRITNLAEPVNPQDAATKNYVDVTVQSAAAGIDSKASVRAVATTNIALSGNLTYDGLTLVNPNRVLAVAQTDATKNGVWIVQTGAWTRALDADDNNEITPGAFWYVEEGTSGKGSQYRCANTGGITLGTTSITIEKFGATANYTASLGVALVANDIQLKLDTGSGSSGLVVSAGGVKIDTSIVARKLSATITGNGSLTQFDINPGFGTTDLIVYVKDSAGNKVMVDILVVSSTQVQLQFGAAVANGVTYRVTIVG